MDMSNWTGLVILIKKINRLLIVAESVPSNLTSNEYDNYLSFLLKFVSHFVAINDLA